MRGSLGLGVVAEEIPAVGLVYVVVLLVGDVDARDDGDNLGNLEDVQLAVLLFYVQEQLLVVGGGLRGAKERVLLAELEREGVRLAFGEEAFPEFLHPESEGLVLEDDDEDEDELPDPKGVEDGDEDLKGRVGVFILAVHQFHDVDA